VNLWFHWLYLDQDSFRVALETASISKKFWRHGLLGTPLSNDVKLPFELAAIDPERPHIRSDQVFAQLAIHLDHDRSRQTGTSHDQVIAFDSRLNAAEQSADVPKFLPRNALLARFLRRGLIRGNLYVNGERVAEEGIAALVAISLIGFSHMQRSKVRFLECPFESAALDTALEP
jgi:hypothetical protein